MNTLSVGKYLTLSSRRKFNIFIFIYAVIGTYVPGIFSFAMFRVGTYQTPELKISLFKGLFNLFRFLHIKYKTRANLHGILVDCLKHA